MAPGSAQSTTGSWVRIVILIVASLELMSALTYLPLLLTSWAQLPKAGFIGLYLLLRVLIFPALAAAAFVLAYRHQRLRLAALLATVQPAVFVFGLIVFYIALAIHGV